MTHYTSLVSQPKTSSVLFKSYLRNPLLSMTFQPLSHRLCKGYVPTPLYPYIFKYSILFYGKIPEKSRRPTKKDRFPTKPKNNPEQHTLLLREPLLFKGCSDFLHRIDPFQPFNKFLDINSSGFHADFNRHRRIHNFFFILFRFAQLQT